MFAPPLPADEDRRLEALHNLRLLDSPPDPRFDRITRLACTATQAPIAVICFVDAQRQWFKSRQGLAAVETPREVSFCGHAILQNETLIVSDTLQDPRFADNPLVVGEPHARFYAGHPIHAPEGERVGTLCIIDRQPRQLSSEQLGALADLAAMVDAEILALRISLATRMAGVGLHEHSARGGRIWWSDAMWEIFGQPPATFRPSYEACLALVHPEDRERVAAHAGIFGKSRAASSLQYRIVRPDGSIRYVQSIASATETYQGSAGRIAGITLDVTERAEAELRAFGQQQQLRESSHQAGMAEVASGVLHSMGNVVNSLGIANATIRRNLKALRLEQLEQATGLIRAHHTNLAAFLVEDERGRHLPEYLPALSAKIRTDVQSAQAELDTVDTLLEHLRNIVSAQQVRAQVGGLRELVNLAEVVDATLAQQALQTSHIEVVRRYDHLPSITTERHKLMLILANLFNNARDAVLASNNRPRRILVRLHRDADHAAVVIEDSGIGMSADVLSRIWRFGFTTKPNGQGFDLHHSANATREIGATIEAHSDGPNKGSRFTLRLPIARNEAAQAGRA